MSYFLNQQLDIGTEKQQKADYYNEMLEVIHFFSNKFLSSLKGIPIVLITTDESGYIIDIAGDTTIQSALFESGIQPGTQYKEGNRNNEIIEDRHTLQLKGEQNSVSYGVSCRLTDSDKLLGSISIITSIENQNPLFQSMLSNLVDSIERELLLREQNRKLNIMNQVMLSRTRNAIIITDAEGKVTEYNHFAEKLSGFRRDEIIGKDIFDSPRTGSYFKEVIHRKKKFEDVEFKFQNNNGESIVCLFDAQPIYDDQNATLIGAFAQLRDITERYIMEQKYNYLAFHDELTSLPNRRHFHRELEKRMLEKDESNGCALLLIDLDSFKMINDTFGHSYGDKALLEATRRLKECIGQKDFIARMSGDEFIILLNSSKEQVISVAEKILDLLNKPFVINQKQFHTTASIGVSFYSDKEVTNIDDFMSQVDAAMYKAKSQGKNGYVIYTPEMYKDTSEEILLENHLRKALELNELKLYYQAQVNSKTGDIIGVEALIRWVHPTLGIVPPNKFIPLAERTGLIIPIGEWVIEEACRQNQEWMVNGIPPIKVSVNLSTQQFLKRNLADVIKDILNRTGLDPKYLELEITESMAMDFSYAESILSQLREIGIQVSMDDFGTGYSSLSYLKRFSINCLKIDKSFVTDILVDESDAKIVETIIAMANSLGIKVIAEGVEDKGQLQFLSKQACFEVQGFYFMKPIPAEQFEEHFDSLVDEFKRKSKEVMD